MSKVVQPTETTNQTPQKKKVKQAPIIHPGDLRSNKGWIYLKDEHITYFR